MRNNTVQLASRSPGLHIGEEPPARSLVAKMFCCLPLPRGRGLSRAYRQTVWDRCRGWLRAPRRGGLCPKEQKSNTGAPGRARSPLPSHLGHPESFPCECRRGFLGVCQLPASPGGCGVRSLWAGVSVPQGRAGWVGWGESRQRWLPRLASRPQGRLLPPGCYLTRHSSLLVLGAEG